MKEDDLSHVVVRAVSEDTGSGLFLRSSCLNGLQQGDVVLRERPVVFAQSYSTSCLIPQRAQRKTVQSASHSSPSSSASVSSSSASQSLPGNTTSKLLTMRCCFGCGRSLVPSLADELERVLAIHKARQARTATETPTTIRTATADTITQPSFSPLVTRGEEVSHSQSANTDTEWLLFYTQAGEPRVASFCTDACRTNALDNEGKRFVTTPMRESEGVEWTPSAATATATAAHRYPSLAFIWEAAAMTRQSACVQTRCDWWPSRRATLDTIHHIAQQFNERLWLIVLLLANVLAQTQRGEAEEAEGKEQGWTPARITAFRRALDDLVASYADGAARVLRVEQRALLRFSWHLIVTWLYYCLNGQDAPHAFAQHDDSSIATFARLEAEAFPLQLLLQLHWLLDANAHAYIVLSPLFTVWCRLAGALPDDDDDEAEFLAHTDATSSTAKVVSAAAALASDGDEEAERSALRQNLLEALTPLFGPTPSSSAVSASQSHRQHRLSSLPPPEEIAPHATGVALFNVATKLNHSCDPSVRFMPNHGPVRAVVRALKPLTPGEELLTSYISVDDSATQDAARRRREVLLSGYGFVCACSRCAVLDV